MKISYLISSHNETDTLAKLIDRLVNIRCDHDEIIILDDFSDNEKTKKILEDFSCESLGLRVRQHALNANYGAHKNWGTKQCCGDYIFQIDGDELPPENILGDNLKAIIESNPSVELIFIPRINDYRGVTEEHARQWGWRLTPSSSIIHEKIIDTNSNEYKFLKENGYILEETKI